MLDREPDVLLFLLHPEGGDRSQEARGVPLPGRHGAERRGHPSVRTRLHRRRRHLDHHLGSAVRRARLLLPGHGWPRRGWRCLHYAQSLLWVGLCPLTPFFRDIADLLEGRAPTSHFPISQRRKRIYDLFCHRLSSFMASVRSARGFTHANHLKVA